jgi:soluble lytic murein transglycosylase-like protein
MAVGWNRSYVLHWMRCVCRISSPLRVAVVGLLAAGGFFLFPGYTVAPGIPDVRVAAAEAVPFEASEASEPRVEPAVAAVEDLLARHADVTADERLRIARAVVTSARHHDVDPFLVAGILLAESSGNPYAISNRKAVGIMQIHVPTWGETVEAEGINLFLLEDNIDFGTRILRDYTRRYGLWDGVMRYLGATEPTDEALAYVQRVQGVYSDRQAD